MGQPLGMRIRPATRSDSTTIAELHTASWRYAYRDALSDEYLAGEVVDDMRKLWESRLTEPAERQHVLVAEQDDALTGFVCLYGNEDEAWGSYLNNLHVARAAQGRGLGALLLHASAALCARSYGGGLYLWVLQSNTNAQGFYVRYGANNAGADVWHAPGGSVAPLFRFSWQSARALEEATASPLLSQTNWNHLG